MSDRLKELADDCRGAAEFYRANRGMAGHGVNVDTIIDIYDRIALVLDAIIQRDGKAAT